MKAYNEIKKELEARKDRNAWNKGVTMYALELLEEYRERAAYEGREAADRAEFKALKFSHDDDWAVWRKCCIIRAEFFPDPNNTLRFLLIFVGINFIFYRFDAAS